MTGRIHRADDRPAGAARCRRTSGHKHDVQCYCSMLIDARPRARQEPYMARLAHVESTEGLGLPAHGLRHWNARAAVAETARRARKKPNRRPVPGD